MYLKEKKNKGEKERETKREGGWEREREERRRIIKYSPFISIYN